MTVVILSALLRRCWLLPPPRNARIAAKKHNPVTFYSASA